MQTSVTVAIEHIGHNEDACVHGVYADEETAIRELKQEGFTFYADRAEWRKNPIAGMTQYVYTYDWEVKT